MINYRSLERSQYEGVVSTYECTGVLKGVNLHQITLFLQRVLKGVQCIVLKACLALALANLSHLCGARDVKGGCCLPMEGWVVHQWRLPVVDSCE